jgi:cytoskeletal protein CcmA (bactofilin family)
MSDSSVIGAGTVVHGNLKGEGSLEVYGRIDGDVQMTGDVRDGESAAVRGQISATTISVSGSVAGDLQGSEAVLLERGAKVVGDLTAPRVGIANGALVRGNVRTEGELSIAHKRPAAPAAAAKPVVVPAAKPAPPPPKSAPYAAKPVAKVEPRPLPAPVEVAVAVAAPAPRPKEPDRRPPPPVLPSLGKGAKGKKKGRDE